MPCSLQQPTAVSIKLFTSTPGFFNVEEWYQCKHTHILSSFYFNLQVFSQGDQALLDAFSTNPTWECLTVICRANQLCDVSTLAHRRCGCNFKFVISKNRTVSNISSSTCVRRRMPQDLFEDNPISMHFMADILKPLGHNGSHVTYLVSWRMSSFIQNYLEIIDNQIRPEETCFISWYMHARGSTVAGAMVSADTLICKLVIRTYTGPAGPFYQQGPLLLTWSNSNPSMGK